MSDYYMKAEESHHKWCLKSNVWIQLSKPHIFMHKYVKYLSKGAVWFIFSFIQRLIWRAFCSLYVTSFTVFISLDIHECMKWLMNGLWHLLFTEIFIFLLKCLLLPFTEFCLWFIFCLVNFCDNTKIYIST